MKRGGHPKPRVRRVKCLLASSARRALALVTIIGTGMGTIESGVYVWEHGVGMAKSGDDLMRWQSIARGGRRRCNPKTYPVDQPRNVLGIPA